jgi:hypothetical protein
MTGWQKALDLARIRNFKCKGGTTNAGNCYQSDPDYRNTNFGHLGVF